MDAVFNGRVSSLVLAFASIHSTWRSDAMGCRHFFISQESAAKFQRKRLRAAAEQSGGLQRLLRRAANTRMDTTGACNEAYVVPTRCAAGLRPDKSTTKTASTNRAGTLGGMFARGTIIPIFGHWCYFQRGLTSHNHLKAIGLDRGRAGQPACDFSSTR